MLPLIKTFDKLKCYIFVLARGWKSYIWVANDGMLICISFFYNRKIILLQDENDDSPWNWDDPWDCKSFEEEEEDENDEKEEENKKLKQDEEKEELK